MKAWAVTAIGEDLQEVDIAAPLPMGTEVVVEVSHCGVCHSDIHFCKGYYDMGGGKRMSILDRGVTLPRAPGHEIVGKVVGLGNEAEGVKLGDSCVIYPWLGCGHCDACAAEQDNLCLQQRSLGVIGHGGFATRVLVPHPRYLVDHEGIDPALAATYACSGITVYAAIRKAMPLEPGKPVVLFGAGGLGLAAIAMLRALGHDEIVSVDIVTDKLEAARIEGATHTVDGNGEDVVDRILAASGGPVQAVFDFVSASSTAAVGHAILAKGGRQTLVGVAGGELTLSLAAMVFRTITVHGSVTGTPQDLRDVIALAKAGKLAPIPVTRLPRNSANKALALLRGGEVTGRLVLTDDSR